MAGNQKKFKNSNLNAILGGPKESPTNFGPAVRSATLIKPVAKPKGLVSLGKAASGVGNVRKGAAFRQLEDKAKQEEESKRDDMTSPEWAVMDIHDLDKPRSDPDEDIDAAGDGDDAGDGDEGCSEPKGMSPPMESVPEEPAQRTSPNNEPFASEQQVHGMRRGAPPSAPPPPAPTSPQGDRLRVQSWADESEQHDGDDEPVAVDVGPARYTPPAARTPPAGRPPQRPVNDRGGAAGANARQKAPGAMSSAAPSGLPPRRPPPGGPPPQPPPAQSQVLQQAVQPASLGQFQSARGPPPSTPPPSSTQGRGATSTAGAVGTPVVRSGKGGGKAADSAPSHDERKRGGSGPEPRAWDGIRRAAHAGDGTAPASERAGVRPGGFPPRHGDQVQSNGFPQRHGDQDLDKPGPNWGSAVACTPAFAPRGPPAERPMSEDFANSGWKEKKLWKPPEEPKAKAPGGAPPRARLRAESGAGGVGQGIAGNFGSANNASGDAEGAHDATGQAAVPSRPAKKPKEPRDPLQALDPESSSSDESDDSSAPPAEYAVLDMTVPRTALVINVSHVLKRLNGCCSLNQLTKAIKHFKEKSGVTLEAFLRANPISFKLEGRIVHLLERGEVWKPPAGSERPAGEAKGKAKGGRAAEDRDGGAGKKGGRTRRGGGKKGGGNENYENYDAGYDDGSYGKESTYYGDYDNIRARRDTSWKGGGWEEKSWKDSNWKADDWGTGWSAGGW